AARRSCAPCERSSPGRGKSCRPSFATAPRRRTIAACNAPPTDPQESPAPAMGATKETSEGIRLVHTDQVRPIRRTRSIARAGWLRRQRRAGVFETGRVGRGVGKACCLGIGGGRFGRG